MEKLKQLLAALKQLDEQLDALLANDQLNDDQRKEHERLTAERKKAAAAVAKEEDRLAREEERLAAEAAAEARERRQQRTQAAGAGRLTQPDAPHAADLPGTQVRPGMAAAQGGFTIPATVRRYSVRNFRGSRNGHSPEVRAYRFGMWALARMAADMPGRFGHFTEATQFVQRHMAASASNDNTGANYLVPEEFGTDLIDLREEYGVVRRLFRNVPMVSDTRTDPRRQSGLTAYFTAEGAAGTESNKNWSDVRLTAKDLMVISRYTNQLSADAVINIGDDLAGEVAYAFANKEDDCGINGDGTSTYGGIIGVRTKLVNCDGAGTASAGVVTQATSNTWAAMVLADFHTVQGKLPQYAYARGPVSWVSSRAFYHTVMQKLEAAAGGNTIMTIAEGDTSQRPLFLGYPVDFSQIMPLVTATTGVQVLFGNYPLGASFGDRQQDSISFSEHASVNGESLWERNQIGIRGTERFDVNVHDAGTAAAAGPIVGLRTG